MNIELKAVPTFRIRDYKKAMDFYLEFLGFAIDWEHRFSPSEPVYMQVSKNGLVLHLSENERFPTGSVVFVETKGIEDYHREISGKGSTYAVPGVAATPWGTKQMEIEDPFGNLLRFNEIGRASCRERV